jgi:hypothetical protein
VWCFSPQALPWQAASSETAAGDIDSLQAVILGTHAVYEILATISPADTLTRAALLQDGSWDAALQRIRWASPIPRPTF